MTTIATDTRFLTVDTFRAERDGCLAYLVVDEASRSALAIDPRLDQVDEILEALTAREVRLTHVLDTHTHADHLSGVGRLAQRTGATVLAHAASKLKRPARRVTGGTTFEVGTKTVTVIDAPGHTPDSLAILVDGPPVHGRRPFRRRRRADRLHGRERLGPLRHAPGLRGPSGRYGGAPRPRLRRPPGDHDRRGEGPESPPA